MNKSYSKIRHIQKLNQLLENRILFEQNDSTITTGTTQTTGGTQTVTSGITSGNTTVEHYKHRFYGLMESTIGDVKPLLSEAIIEKKAEEDTWCKSNLTDPENQICLIKTPSSVDKNGCQSQTGNIARVKGYVTAIKIDISKTNFCKSVWEKIK